VDQGFIKVEDQGLLALVLPPHRRQAHQAHPACSPLMNLMACCICFSF
jgi:hypothetical protein